jgi:hypothetical protein
VSDEWIASDATKDVREITPVRWNAPENPQGAERAASVISMKCWLKSSQFLSPRLDAYSGGVSAQMPLSRSSEEGRRFVAGTLIETAISIETESPRDSQTPFDRKALAVQLMPVGLDSRAGSSADNLKSLD